MSGTDVTLTCTAGIAVSSNFNANLQWLGPDGSVLRQMMGTPTLDLELAPVTEFGEYTCVATLSSPDFPGTEATVSAISSITRMYNNEKKNYYN